MLDILRQLYSDESGATAVEYGIMVALIAVIIIAAVRALGGAVDDTFSHACLEGLQGDC